MSSITIRAYSAPDARGKSQRVLDGFAQANFHLEELDEALLNAITQDAIFDQAVFAGSNEATETLQRILTTETAPRERLAGCLRDASSSTYFITIDKAIGTHRVYNLANMQLDRGADFVSLHRTLSLTDLFVRTNGLMRATSGYHYQKPSQLHSSQFLRASNTVEDGRHISSISFWLLPYVAKFKIRRIVVDTSGIASVGVALAHEAFALGLTPGLPTVESHSSYGGLESIRVPDPQSTLFLVSASTSGAMAQLLVKQGAEPDHIVTLFYLNEQPPESGETLCELRQDQARNPGGLTPIKNYRIDDCPFCKNRSFPVAIEGDQFSLEPPNIQQVLITKTDLPAERAGIFDDLAGLRFFKAFRTVHDREFETFLDVETLFSSDSTLLGPLASTVTTFLARWSQVVKRGLPIHTTRIVHASYPFSKQLAEGARKISLEQDKSASVDIIDTSTLGESTPSAGTATLVIASCLDDANELMAINRDLRVVQPQGNTTYIAPIMRAASKLERDRITSNLTFGEYGANTFSLFCVADIELPKCDAQHSWIVELRTLKAMGAWADRNELDFPSAITDRIATLETAPSRGLIDDLFWPSLQGKPLRIRSDFTMLNTFGGSRAISQADVFAVVSALLHCLRQGVAGKPRLTYRAYERTVVSPDNFQRFNDGVIQAAILRSSRGYDIAYGNCDRATSQQLFELLKWQLQKAPQGEGEALVEFLIALSCKRLTLHPQHEIDICELVMGTRDLPPYVYLFAKFIKQQATQER